MDLTDLQGSRDYSSDEEETNNENEDSKETESEETASDDSDSEFILEKCKNTIINAPKRSKKRLLSPGKTINRSILGFKNYEKAKKAELDVKYAVVAKSTGSLTGEVEKAEASIENVEKYNLNVGLPQEMYHIPLFGLQTNKK